MDWVLTIAVTSASLYSLWLYGNKSWKAPLLGVTACLIYISYYVIYGQLPLIVPTLVMMSVQIRNLVKMRRVQNGSL